MQATLVKPSKQRRLSEDLAGFLVITIPSPRKRHLIAQLAFQVLVCIVLESLAVSLLINWALKNPKADGVPLLVIWLLGFTAGSLIAVYALLWQIGGRERIEINGSTLCISRNLSWFIRPKEYAAADIKDLRVSHAVRSRTPWGLMFEEWGLSGAIIAFDYGAKTCRFGIGIDEAEAKQIVAEIRQKFPQYRSDNSAERPFGVSRS